MPGGDLERLRERVEVRIRDAAPSARIERLGTSEPLLTGEHAPIHRILCDLVGQRGSRGAPFATDGGPLGAFDLDSVVWGPGSIEVAHRANEWLPKSDLERCADLLPKLVDELCR